MNTRRSMNSYMNKKRIRRLRFIWNIKT